MQRLTPQAEQILEHLSKVGDLSKAYDVGLLFHHWDNYVRRLSFFNRYPDMTDHGPAHANSVVGLVAQLAFSAGGPAALNPSELFCLTGAAWLHDIGMYTTGDTSARDVYDAMTIRKKHSRLSCQRMRDEMNIIFPKVHERDVQVIGVIAAYHQSRTALDGPHREELIKDHRRRKVEKAWKEFRDAAGLEADRRDRFAAAVETGSQALTEGAPAAASKIVKEMQKALAGTGGVESGLIEEHRKRPAEAIQSMPDLVEGTLEQELDEMGWADGIAYLKGLEGRSEQEPVRVKLLAALLRVLDQCDIQMIRAGNLDFLVRRIDRSFQQQRVYEELLKAIPEGSARGASDSPTLRDRVAQEVKFFRETSDYYLRDFWVERTFIVGNRIYIKLNDERRIRAQLKLVPASLSEARARLRNDGKGLSEYLKHAHDYIEGELICLDRILQDAKYTLTVESFPQTPEERHHLQAEVWKRAPFRDARPRRPSDFAEPAAAAELARRLRQKDAPRVLVVYGPPGRGRRQFVRSLVKAFLRQDPEQSGLFWYAVERHPQEVHVFVREVAAYLAANGEHALNNVFHDEGLVTEQHERFCLDILAEGELPGVVVLQDINRLDQTHRDFFGQLFKGFGGKLIVATSTRWPSAEAMETYFSGLGSDLALLECPRIPRGGADRLLRSLPGPNDWAALWESWGREVGGLAVALEQARLATAAPEALPRLVEGAMQSRLLSIWSALGNVRLNQTVLELAGAPGVSSRADSDDTDLLQELTDRALVRWTEQGAANPWEDDDALSLRSERPGRGPQPWVHPGLRRLVAR